MKRFILAFLLSAGTLASFQAGASDLGFVGAVEGALGFRSFVLDGH